MISLDNQNNKLLRTENNMNKCIHRIGRIHMC
jgi:hypothetical protein